MINIRHFGIMVNDLKVALAFYQDLLGMKIYSEGTLDENETLDLLGVMGSKLTYVKLSCDEANSLLELYLFHSGSIRKTYFEEARKPKFEHVAFTVKDVELLHEQLANHPISSLKVDKEGKHKLFFARDPFGNLIEFVQHI